MYESYVLTYPNRVARDGDELVTYRFPMGGIGMAFAKDLRAAGNSPSGSARTFWSRLRDLFNPPAAHGVRPVSILPGTRLLVRDISERLQDELGVGWAEKVVFTEIPGNFVRSRDGIRFSNGREIPLQRLHEGQRVRVLDSSCVEFLAPYEEPLAVAG